MRTLVSVIVLLILTAVPAAAQHVCDRPAVPATVTVTGASYDFTVCAPQADAIDGLNLYVDDVKTDLGVVAPQGGANAAGKLGYFVTVALPTTGQRTIRTSTYTTTSTGAKQEGPLSSPFALSREKAAPANAPTNHIR